MKKGFLHANIPEQALSRQQVICGLIPGLVFACVLYTLMYYFREMLRILWTDPVYKDFVVLSRGEMNFYNMFCAYTAVLFGQSVTFTYWLARIQRKLGIPGYKAAAIRNNLWTLNLISFWMLVQLVAVTGLVFFWRPDYEFGLYPDFNLYFVLLIVVLFLQQWVSIGRIFKRRGIRWMMVSAVIVSGLSFALSRINFTDYEAYNKRRMVESIFYNYHIDWPSVEYKDLPGFRTQGYNARSSTIYIVHTNDYPADSALVAIMHTPDPVCFSTGFEEVPLDSVGGIIRRQQQSKRRGFSDPLFPTRVAFNLKINRDVPMSVVNKLKTDMAVAGVKWVGIAMQPEKYEPGESFRTYEDRLMLVLGVPASYSYTPQQLAATFQDAARSSGRHFDIVDSRDGWYTIGGNSVTKAGLRNSIKTLMAQNPDALFCYHINDDATLQNYIDVMTNYLKAIDQLRREYISNLNDPDQEDEAQKRYPLCMLEITEQMRQAAVAQE